MASSTSPLLPITLTLTLITFLSLPFPSLCDDCPYPCLPPPQMQTPIYPSPPPPQTPIYSPPQNPYTPETPSYWNYPPPPQQNYFQPPGGGYQPPGGGYSYPAPPPPNPIVPWYPWYPRTPPSSSIGLLPQLALNLIIFGGLLMGLMVF